MGLTGFLAWYREALGQGRHSAMSVALSRAQDYGRQPVQLPRDRISSHWQVAG